MAALEIGRVAMEDLEHLDEIMEVGIVKEILTPDMESQAGLNLWYGYLKITGSTGAFERNAPVLKGRRKSPFVVVPSAVNRKSNQPTERALYTIMCRICRPNPDASR
ncbi:unnamed protein product [Camellia sinensis]